MTTFQINQEVVRTQGAGYVGTIGTIVAIDHEANRVQVKWIGQLKTWVSVKVVMPTSVPYEITPFSVSSKKITHSKYRKI